MPKTHKDVTVIVKGVLAAIPDDRIGYMVQTAMAGRCKSVDVAEIEPESEPAAAEPDSASVEAAATTSPGSKRR